MSLSAARACRFTVGPGLLRTLGFTSPPLMRFEGTLKSWTDDRGFGFIEPDQGGAEVFVHIKTIVNLQGRPQVGQRFSFEIELGPQGKKRAAKVLPLRASRPIGTHRNSPTQWGTATLFALPSFLLLYVVVAAIWRPPAVVALYYLLVSIVTFAAYALDKAAAARRDQRTPEKVLHLFSLVGGWPGALLAQQFLRHKSAKIEFRSTFWFTVVLNVAAFLMVCSPSARVYWPRM
jgi:uncharacterized membrane protein YsdA (DUF1294 family)/cold shock CspA family protein